MGGYGSGGWTRWRSKPTVENCPTIDVNRMNRRGHLTPGVEDFFSWSCSGRTIAAAHFSIMRNGEDGLVIWITYRVAGGETVNEPIPLDTTYPFIGGRRWWFTCPLSVGGIPCGRRVTKLYLRGRYFGCRHCHGLTYTSCKEAHKEERFWNQMDKLMGYGREENPG